MALKSVSLRPKAVMLTPLHFAGHLMKMRYCPAECGTVGTLYALVQQPSRHVYIILAKIPPNQVIADFGRGSSVESESE